MSTVSSAYAAITHPTPAQRCDSAFVADYCEQQWLSDELDRLYETPRHTMTPEDLAAYRDEVTGLIGRAIMLRYRQHGWADLCSKLARYGELILLLASVYEEGPDELFT